MRRSAATAFFAAALLAILYATLSPMAQPDPALLGRVRWRPVPGDLLRNLVLFIPLGAAWIARSGSPKAALAGALALSALLELAQLAVPGRYSSPWDALANMLGAGLGAGLALGAPRWLAPSRAAADRRVLAAAALATAWLLLGSWIGAPSPPPGALFAHWTPSLANFSAIDATLRTATLDGIQLPHGALADPDALRRALAGDFQLQLTGVAGRPTVGLAALLWLTNQSGREALLVGVEGSDLILRWPGRGAEAGLEAAPLRLPGLLAQHPQGTPLSLRIERRGAETCAALDARRGCGLGLTVGDGWRVLAPGLRLPPRLRDGLAAAFVAALWLPIGFWFAPAAAPFAALCVLGAATGLTPRLGSLLPTPASQWIAAAVGFALAALFRRAQLARAPGPPR